MNAAMGTEWFLLWKPGVAQKRKIRGQSQELYSLGRAEEMRPRQSVLFNSSDVSRERASVMDILEKFPTPRGNGWNSWREIQIKTSQCQWEQKCALITLWEHSEMLEWYILPYQIYCSSSFYRLKLCRRHSWGSSSTSFSSRNWKEQTPICTKGRCGFLSPNCGSQMLIK